MNMSSSTCSPTSIHDGPWSQSGWLSTEIIPLGGSPSLWSVELTKPSSLGATRELTSRLTLPPPPNSPPPPLSPISRDVCFDDSSASAVTPTPSPTITQPFLKLPTAQASKSVFPPSCPVLISNSDTLAPPEIGVVKAVAVDLQLAPQNNTSRSQFFYDVLVSSTGGKRLRTRIPERELQFAPQCPVWFQSLQDPESQQPGVVLASYHPPHMADSRRDCYYSVRVESPYPLIHHGVLLQQLSYRSNFALQRPIGEPQPSEGSLSVPSEVVTTIASSDSSSTGSLTESPAPLDSPTMMSSPPGFSSSNNNNGKKFSSKIVIPNWISDTADLENNLMKAGSKFRRRLEQKINCNLEVGQSAGDKGSPENMFVSILSNDSTRLSGARVYVENYIIDRIHERLEGRMLYQFALEQEGEDLFDGEWTIVRQRSPGDRKSEVWMTAIPLPSEDCVRAVIGKGGRFINFLRNMTGCSVTLESREEIVKQPFVYIFAAEREKVEEAALLVNDKIQGKQ